MGKTVKAQFDVPTDLWDKVKEVAAHERSSIAEVATRILQAGIEEEIVKMQIERLEL